MNIKIGRVFERDIDLLMINKFIHDESLISYFLNKINKNGYKIISLEHSLVDIEAGESDITIILEKNNHKIGLLIEDKIDAPAMIDQRKRYNIRGDKGINSKQYDEYYVFLIAPKEYLESNGEAHLYENQVSYEELRTLMNNDLYAITLINKAIEEKKSGYIIIENQAVTSFWKNYYKYIKDNYPKIMINEVHGPRGSNAQWPEFKTYYPSVKIIQKSDRGVVDLTFFKMADYINIFNKYTNEYITEDMLKKRTGKSMSIRLPIPVIDFKYPFEECTKEINEALDKVSRLYNLLEKINVSAMYKELTNNNAEINNINNFKKEYPKGIIVNFDKRAVFRSSTGKLEKIGDSVNYPYIQRYQTGFNPTSVLFMIKNNTLYKLNRLESFNPDSNYIAQDVNQTISEDFYNDTIFNEPAKTPVNVLPEHLLEIINRDY